MLRDILSENTVDELSGVYKHNDERENQYDAYKFKKTCEKRKNEHLYKLYSISRSEIFYKFEKSFVILKHNSALFIFDYIINYKKKGKPIISASLFCFACVYV